jgi:hypothetical protein
MNIQQKMIFWSLIIFFLPLVVYSQPSFILSLYPPQHGLNIPADAELHISFHKPIAPTSICDSAIYIYSNITGLHKWRFRLANGIKDLYLQPKHWWGVGDKPFNAGERVSVTLTTRLRYADGSQFEGFTWDYTVAVRQNHGGHFTPLATFGGIYQWLCFDANGDRYPDVILDDNIWDKLAVFLNDGKGKLVFSHQSPKTTGSFSSHQSFDFDRNGTIDISMSNRWIQFNDGKGNFEEKQIFPEQAIYNKVYDFNNDGLFDLVSRTIENSTIKPELFIMRSNNGIAYIDTDRISNLPIIPDFFQSGESYDLNNDGCTDFVIAGESENILYEPVYSGFLSIMMKSNAAPSIFQIQKFDIHSHWFYGNDFNGDGWIDYVFSGDDAGYYHTLLFLNDRTGYFVLSFDHAESGSYGAAGDIDGDGDIDLFLVRSRMIDAMPVTFENYYILGINNGNGVCNWSNLYPLPWTNGGYAWPKLVDLDLDGDLDVLIHGPGVQMVIANEEYATSVDDFLNPIKNLGFKITIYPNPFNTTTVINISGLEFSSNYRMRLYDIRGRLIRHWQLPASEQNIRLPWDGNDDSGHQVASGIYILQVLSGKSISTKKILLIR